METKYLVYYQKRHNGLVSTIEVLARCESQAVYIGQDMVYPHKVLHSIEYSWTN